MEKKNVFMKDVNKMDWKETERNTRATHVRQVVWRVFRSDTYHTYTVFHSRTQCEIYMNFCSYIYLYIVFQHFAAAFRDLFVQFIWKSVCGTLQISTSTLSVFFWQAEEIKKLVRTI